MTVKMRLNLFLWTFIALIALLGGYGIISMSQVTGQYEMLSTQSVPNFFTLGQLDRGGQSLIASAQRILRISKDMLRSEYKLFLDTVLSNEVALFSESKDAVLLLLANHEEGTSDEAMKKQIREFRESLAVLCNEISNIKNDGLSAFKQKDHEAALADHSRWLKHIVGMGIDVEKESIEHGTSRLQEKSENTNLVTIIFISLSVVGGTAAVTLFKRYFDKSFMLFEEAGKKIASGEAGVTVDVEGKSEFATFAHSFNQFTKKVNETTVPREHLEAGQQKLISTERTLQIEKKALHNIQNTVHEMFHTILYQMRISLDGFSNALTLWKSADALAEKNKHTIVTHCNVLQDIINAIEYWDEETSPVFISEDHFSMADLFNDMITYYNGVAQKKGIELHVKVSGNMPKFITSDYSRLKRMLSILMENALRHTHKGTIVLDASAQEFKGKDALVVQCVVNDTGNGIEPERLKKEAALFLTPGGSLYERHQKTSHGWITCAWLAKMLGGDLQVTSVVDGGTRVSFTFLAKVYRADDYKQNVLLPLSEMSKKSVMFIVPESPAAEKMVNHWKKYFKDVDLEPSSLNAKYTLSKRIKVYDIIGLDFFESGTTKHELINTMKSKGLISETRVIALVDKEIPGDDVLANELGFSAYLKTQSLEETFIPTLQKLYAKKIPVKEALAPEYDLHAHFQDINVLVVESGIMQCNGFKDVVSQLGCGVDCAVSEKEVAARLAKSRYQIIFVNIDKPSARGITIAKEIRTSGNTETAIIAITAHADKKIIEECLAAGMTDYLIRPVSFLALKEKILLCGHV